MTAKTLTGTQQHAPDRGKKFLVVVDGNPSELFSAGMLLQRLEYSVFTASTAEEALQLMEVTLPSAIITELLLPKTNGMDLLNRIKQDPRTKDVPVIIHTHMKDPKIEELCMVAGCASYLRKPTDPNTLYRSIQYVMESTPRHYIRLKTCFKVLIGDEARGSVTSSECVTALSENGIYIRTVRQRPVNALLPITIFIADRKVSVRAMVLYCITGANGPLKEPGMGLKFVDIADDDREFIKAFIKDQVTRDIAS
jgi:CheY-like chemotaxis protein